MLVCLLDHNEIVHYECIVKGQTVNQQCYLGVLTRLGESFRRKKPGLLSNKLIFHPDNAPAHDILRVRGFLTKNSITHSATCDTPTTDNLVPLNTISTTSTRFKQNPKGTPDTRSHNTHKTSILPNLKITFSIFTTPHTI